MFCFLSFSKGLPPPFPALSYSLKADICSGRLNKGLNSLCGNEIRRLRREVAHLSYIVSAVYLFYSGSMPGVMNCSALSKSVQTVFERVPPFFIASEAISLSCIPPEKPSAPVYPKKHIFRSCFTCSKRKTPGLHHILLYFVPTGVSSKTIPFS